MADRGGVNGALDRLHRAGWCVGVSAFAAVDGSGRLVWCVDGRNGENVLRAEGATEGEAWAEAIGQARGVGMLDGVRPSAGYVG